LANDEDNDHSTDPAREGGAFLLEGPITEADARQREREKKDDEYKRRQLLFNFLLVVVGSFTVGVYAYQASIMNSSLKAAKVSANAAKSAANTANATMKAMKTSAVETSAQIDRLIAQQQRTANSMEQNLVRSKAALDASIKIARTDQKAWVGVKTARVSFDNDGPEVEFIFTNGGKTPAIDLHFVFLAYFGPLGTNPPFNEAESDAKGRIVIVPNVDTAAKARPSVIPKADIDGIKAGIISFFAYGTVWYKDIFEGRRKTTFCGIYNPIIKQFDACVEHNTAE
jgi:hypothetical protein